MALEGKVRKFPSLLSNWNPIELLDIIAKAESIDIYRANHTKGILIDHITHLVQYFFSPDKIFTLKDY